MKSIVKTQSPELELNVSPTWSEMGDVNQAIGDFLTGLKLSDDAVAKYTMVGCELVENAIKYGFFPEATGTIRVLLKVDRGTISVQVANPIGEVSHAYLTELDRTIQWVRGFQAPFEAYIARMRAISREPPDMDKSGLGLARITYEGRAVLDFYLDENDMLSVSAVSAIEG
jgi:two-component sensor histidine kinase